MNERNQTGNGSGEPVAPSDEAVNSQRRWWLAAGATGIASGAAWSWWSRTPSPDPRAASAAGAPQNAAPSDSTRLADDFWALQLPQPDGTPLRLGSLRGGAMLINFWATWCPPCVKEMPLLDSFYKQYSSKGLRMVGIAIDGPTAVKSFLQKTPVAFPIALAGAEGTGLARTLGNSQGALPYTVLAGPDGRILHRQMGELSADILSRWAGDLNLGA